MPPLPPALPARYDQCVAAGVGSASHRWTSGGGAFGGASDAFRRASAASEPGCRGGGLLPRARLAREVPHPRRRERKSLRGWVGGGLLPRRPRVAPPLLAAAIQSRTKASWPALAADAVTAPPLCA